jgi:hypothetical protein
MALPIGGPHTGGAQSSAAQVRRRSSSSPELNLYALVATTGGLLGRTSLVLLPATN